MRRHPPFEVFLDNLSFLLLFSPMPNTANILTREQAVQKVHVLIGRELFLLVCVIWSLGGNLGSEDKQRMVNAFFISKNNRTITILNSQKDTKKLWVLSLRHSICEWLCEGDVRDNKYPSHTKIPLCIGAFMALGEGVRVFLLFHSFSGENMNAAWYTVRGERTGVAKGIVYVNFCSKLGECCMDMD